MNSKLHNWVKCMKAALDIRFTLRSLKRSSSAKPTGTSTGLCPSCIMIPELFQQTLKTRYIASLLCEAHRPTQPSAPQKVKFIAVATYNLQAKHYQ